MNIVDIINDKKNKKILTDLQIKFMIDNYVNGQIPDYQMSALLMAIRLNGMEKSEIVSLTDAMIKSGETINLTSIPGIKLDKHSTGGVGDKTSLVLGPIVAANGGIIAKMSGHGLGYTGGTLDKLETVPGFKFSLDIDQFLSVVKKTNLSIIGQTSNLVPADKLIYALRDVTSTTDSIPLIASSIMSKKIATGADIILLDVKSGNGAFMRDVESAKELSKIMIEIGHSLGKKIFVEITDMNQPLGKMIGNKNEIVEAIQTLSNKGDNNFVKLCLTSSATLLHSAGLFASEEEAYKAAKESIVNGKALEKFYEFIAAQGGDVEALKKPYFWMPMYKHEIKSKDNGFLRIQNAMIFGEVSMNLGAGRKTKEESIDPEAGIELKKVTNDYVKKDETLFVLYSSSKKNFKELESKIRTTFTIESKVSKNEIFLARMK